LLHPLLLLQLTSKLSTHAAALTTLRERYKKELLERRRLHNLVQELRGNIRVYCRARPALATDVESGSGMAASFPQEGEIVMVNNKKQTKSWEFDQVFVPGLSNEVVYRETEPLIVSVMDGYNVCIFAYGQTGSGKTHTMEGTEADRGINYRALDSLFKIQVRRATTATSTAAFTDARV
jgi:kinesin family member C2/C3